MTRRLIIVDPNVNEYTKWLSDLDQIEADVLVLDASQDGLQQIAEYIVNTGNVYDALDIVSHGSEGTLYLGTSTLDQSSLDSYAELFGQIGQGLTANGDILLYGCDVAQGEAGAKFIASLANMTGADVTASDDASGPTALNGDSQLESQTGTIEAAALGLEPMATMLAANSAPTFNIGDGKVTTAIGTSYDNGYSVTVHADGKILVVGTRSISNFTQVHYYDDNRLIEE